MSSLNTYYVAGVPYSSELYHYGILGQKWGVRRYQNKDGSLTSEGRKHYGVKSERGSFKDVAGKVGNAVKVSGKKVVSAVGNAAKAATAYSKEQIKKSHPSLMTDEELNRYTQRIIAEKRYSDLVRDQHSKSVAGRAKALIGDVLGGGVRTLGRAGFEKIAREMTKSPLERENERLERISRNKELQKKLSDKKDLDDINRDLEKQVRNKELREKLSEESSFSALQKARSIMGNPNASASQISEANKILKDYSAATSYMNKLFGETSSRPEASVFPASSSTDSIFAPERTERTWGPKKSSVFKVEPSKTNSGYKDASEVYRNPSRSTDVKLFGYKSALTSEKSSPWKKTDEEKRGAVFELPREQRYVNTILERSSGSDADRFKNYRMSPIDDEKKRKRG